MLPHLHIFVFETMSQGTSNPTFPRLQDGLNHNSDVVLSCFVFISLSFFLFYLVVCVLIFYETLYFVKARVALNEHY